MFGFVLHSTTPGLLCSREMFVGMLALLGATSSALGLAISALAPTGDAALAIGPALMVLMQVVRCVMFRCILLRAAVRLLFLFYLFLFYSHAGGVFNNGFSRTSWCQQRGASHSVAPFSIL